MKYNLRIEDLVLSLNEWLRNKFPHNTGNFVIKKNIETGLFPAIKKFIVEVYYIDYPSKINNSLFKIQISKKTVSESDEDKAWNDLGIMLNIELFKFIMKTNWEEAYGSRN